MDLQREIFLKIHALKRERDKESLSLKEGSILRPLRQVRSSTAQLQKSIVAPLLTETTKKCANFVGLLLGR